VEGKLPPFMPISLFFFKFLIRFIFVICLLFTVVLLYTFGAIVALIGKYRLVMM